MNYNFRYYCYLKNQENKYIFQTKYIELDKVLELYCDFMRNDYSTFKECEKLYKRLSARKVRLRQKIELLLNKYDEPIFLTMTFRDEILNNTTAFTRYQYVKDFLTKNFEMYIANVDFGKTNGREHYHAICNCALSDEQRLYYFGKCGAINFIYIYSKNSKKLSKYLDKLVNHSFKDTTINKCIYSRNRIKK